MNFFTDVLPIKVIRAGDTNMVCEEGECQGRPSKLPFSLPSKHTLSETCESDGDGAAASNGPWLQWFNSSVSLLSHFPRIIHATQWASAFPSHASEKTLPGKVWLKERGWHLIKFWNTTGYEYFTAPSKKRGQVFKSLCWFTNSRLNKYEKTRLLILHKAFGNPPGTHFDKCLPRLKANTYY